jgi:deoxyribonuclease V
MVSLPGGLAFPSSAAAARMLIPALAARVEPADRLAETRVIGGADASCTRFDPTRSVHAAMVALAWPALSPLATAGAVTRGGLPYVPGLLGFREVPALAAAFARLTCRPDLILVDGHGLAHPRGLGIACLLGLVLDVPTIGVAKSLLVGAVAGTLPETPGATAPVLWQGREIGVALRSRRGAGPVYVSVGHRVSLPTALAWVRRCQDGHRLPVPIRAAHAAAGALRLSARAGVA